MKDTASNPYEQHLDQVAANYTPLSPLSMLARAAAVYPDRLAVVHGERHYSWSETFARCRQLASALEARGIGLGDTVAVIATNIPAFYEALFGVPAAGAVINPMMLEGQVHGGVAQGIGQALLEQTVYDNDSGQLLSGTFMDYAMPRADNLPNFSFATRNVPCRANPLGVKGAGEAGAVGAPPALINAIVDALHHKGVRHVDMPATPQTIWKMIQAAR